MLFNIKLDSVTVNKEFEDKSLLLVFIDKDEKTDEKLSEVTGKYNLDINKNLKKDFTEGDRGEIRQYLSGGKPDLAVIKKVKKDKKFNSDFFRNYIAGLIQSLENEGVEKLYVVIPEFADYKDVFENEKVYCRSFAEGVFLGNYSYNKYKSDRKEPSDLDITFIDPAGHSKKVLNETVNLFRGVDLARDLSNEPAIDLTPEALARKAKSELEAEGVEVTLFDRDEIERRGMKALLAVGDSSTNKPVFIRMHYKPENAAKKIVLTGKGITYDSGGLSIKPTSGMIDMNGDMSGAAAVIGIIKAAAALNLPVELVGLVPAAENMIAGNSYKPGDIIGSLSGKTIEVRDTDAEGRIVLADALAFAADEKPDHLLNYATLTGAAVVAVGELAASFFTEDDNLAGKLSEAGYRSFERVWRLPFWSDYDQFLESKTADVSNLGPRWAGAITAGRFLNHFVAEGTSWAHLDIAGPSLKHKANNYTEKYNTGFGVRLTIDFLENLK